MHIYIPSIRGRMKEGARTDFRAQTEDEGSIHAWKGVCIMNKIYKVVWNAARNSYMVGSEFIRGSHSAGSRRISGRKLKGLVAAALLAGAILSPAGLMPASASDRSWGGNKDYATEQALEEEAHKRAQGDQELQADISDLQENEKQQNQDIHDLQEQTAGGMEKDHKQDAAIDHNYEIDKAQDEAIEDLQEKTEGGMEKDRKQDAAIDHNYEIDKAQGEAIEDLQEKTAGGMEKDRKQDAAIDHNYEIDKAQDEAIEDLQEKTAGGMEKDHKQDAAIEMGIQKDEKQDAAIEMGIQKDEKQDAAIAMGIQKDEKQDAAIEMGIRKDEQQDVAIGKAHESVSAGNGLNVTEGTNPNGGTNYEVSLDNDFTVGDEDSHVTVTGTEGNIEATGTITAGSVTLNKDESGTVSGLTNKTWDKNANYEDSSLAATESQLQQAIQQTTEELTNNSVQYDKTPEGTVDKTSVTLGDGQTAVHLGNVMNGTIAEGSTDAVNGGQLWAVQQDVNANTAAIGSLNSRVDTLDGRIDKVGANAAALAALHPLDFDPDDKWDFAAGYGNYGNENAMAVGAFYRPNEDTMFSVGGSFGTGENMVNAGVSFKIGQGNHVSTSRVAMAKEIETLRHNVAQLTELVNQLVGAKDQISNSMTTPFPDVPENHWAYETVEQMRERGIVEGYPDGTFGGDRQMTRYEFATIVYRALQKGIGMNEDIQRLVDEFKPELALIRVDTIAQDSEGNPTIERVRVNKA